MVCFNKFLVDISFHKIETFISRVFADAFHELCGYAPFRCSSGAITKQNIDFTRISAEYSSIGQNERKYLIHH